MNLNCSCGAAGHIESLSIAMVDRTWYKPCGRHTHSHFVGTRYEISVLVRKAGKYVKEKVLPINIKVFSP